MKSYPKWFTESTRNDFSTEELINLLGLSQTKNSQVKLHQIRCDHINRRRVFDGPTEKIQSRVVKGKLKECDYKEEWDLAQCKRVRNPLAHTGDYYHYYEGDKKCRNVFYTKRGVERVFEIFTEREAKKNLYLARREESRKEQQIRKAFSEKHKQLRPRTAA